MAQAPQVLQDFIQNLTLLPVIAPRMGAAFACGALLGWERQLSNKPAGLRTNTLICIGACMYMLVGMLVNPALGGPGPDPTRVGAQVVTGVGFLGAGTIMRGRLGVAGLTTAATIWVAAAVGMWCGAGYPIEAFLFTLTLLFVLTSLHRAESILIGRCHFKTVEVRVAIEDRRTQALVGGLFEQAIKGDHLLIWITEGKEGVLRAAVCGRHLRHRSFLAECWRLPGVLDIQYSDGTVPSVPFGDREDDKPPSAAAASTAEGGGPKTHA